MTGNMPGRSLLALLLLVMAFVHAGYRMTPSLEGHFRHGFLGANAARYSLAGRNYLRDGFTSHFFAPDLGADTGVAHKEALYLHHPPAVPLLVGMSFSLFGESESAATIPFFISALLSLVLLYLVARRCLSGVGPAAATFLFAVAPMTGFYGSHVDPQGSLLTVFILLFILSYLRFLETGHRRELFGMAMALGFGLLVDWPVAYLAALVPLGDQIFRGGRKAPVLFFLPVLAVAIFLLFLFWIFRLGQSASDDLFGPAGVRTLQPLLEAPPEQLLAAIKTAFLGVWTFFTPAILLLALIGLFSGVQTIASEHRDRLRLTVILLLAAGVIHVLLFPQGFLVHDYWTFLLLAPIALLGGATVEFLRANVAARSGEGFQVLLVLAVCLGTGFLADRTTLELYEGRNDDRHARFGEALREQVRPGMRLLTNVSDYNPTRSDLLVHPEFTYYLDRALRGGIQMPEHLARAEAEEGPFDLFLYVPPGDGGMEPPVVSELRRTGTPRQIHVLGWPVEIFTLPK